MKILVTGAKGFVGKNLCAQLNNIKDGKACCYGELQIEDVFEYDLDSTLEQLDNWCKEADFVFNLAGVNRPKENDEFMKGNFGFVIALLLPGINDRPSDVRQLAKWFRGKKVMINVFQQQTQLLQQYSNV